MIIAWLPAVLWAIVIFLFSSLTAKETVSFSLGDFIIKKSAHVTEYAIFATLLYRGFKMSGMGKVKAGLISLVLCIIYAFTDEYHQSFTPGRQPTIRDVVFDTIGASIGIYIVWRLLPNLPPKLKNLARSWHLI